MVQARQTYSISRSELYRKEVIKADSFFKTIKKINQTSLLYATITEQNIQRNRAIYQQSPF